MTETGSNRQSSVRIADAPAALAPEAYIHGEKITLRPVTYADTACIVRWRNDPDVRTRFVYRRDFTAEGHEDWLRGQVETGRAVQFVILTDETPCGSVYLRDVDPVKKSAEYGIFIGEAHARGKGCASEAARLMLRYAFETCGLKTVGLRVYKDNAAAIASYKQAGFRIVRELTGVRASDGTTGDMYWMEAGV